MEIKTILTATFSETERRNWLGADWGCFTRQANEQVATTIIKMLGDGIDIRDLRDGYKLADQIASASAVEEASDSEPRNIICNTLSFVAEGRIPVLTEDWHTDEEEGDN